jgi:putative tryptophan/tyrosine transport system substrate-binding protein
MSLNDPNATSNLLNKCESVECHFSLAAGRKVIDLSPKCSEAAVQRREFITLLCGVAVAWPPAAHAQQPERMRLIGVLMGYADSDSEAQAQIAAFRDGLQKLGWMEGRNTRIDTRWAKPTDAAAMHRIAKELVALQPEVILASSTPTTTALLQQTRTIPVVFATVGDPIGSGFVASFPRPGGNVTGFITVEGSLGGKWLELLKQIAPYVDRVALLLNPATATYAESYLNAFKAAAASVGVQAVAAPVHDRSEFDAVMLPRLASRIAA